MTSWYGRRGAALTKKKISPLVVLTQTTLLPGVYIGGSRKGHDVIVNSAPFAQVGGLGASPHCVGESVFAKAGPRFAACGNSNHALSGVSGGTDAWRQSPGGSGGYALRPRVGGSVYRGNGGRGRGRGVYFG